MSWIDLLVGNCYANLPPECFQEKTFCSCSGFPLILPIIVFGMFVVICFRTNRNYNEIAENYFLSQQSTADGSRK